ncbi:MAG: acyl-CoA dehydrogenase family protein [Gemmatimonadaceae bacterium]|nr:acyl-CoA dehydrogenase family protein [Gemmatimonadaceae bacterium]
MALTPPSFPASRKEASAEIQRTAREFAAAEITPFTAQWDRDSHFEPTLVKKLGELGFLGMLIPEQYDGLGMDALTYLMALEEISTHDASVGVMMSVHNSLPTQMILNYGNEEQKQRWLPPMARGELLGAFALSEPGSGSDASSLTAQAVRDGDDWIITGTKSWVTQGTHAGVILVMARTDTPDARKGSKGISTFIITPDLPGFSVGKKEDKLGMRASPTVMLTFDEMRVPGDRLLGAEGMGFIYAMQSLDHGRLGIAAQALGIATAAAEAARAYADDRKQFGQPIRDFQAVQFKLADMASRITATRALLYATARAKDAGESITQFGAMCKLLASETAMWTTTNAIQIFGGYGYVTEYPVERLFRDAKVTEIYEGTSEVQRIVIARELYPRG